MAELSEIRNFLPLTDRLGTAGQPTREQFATVRNAGYQVIINLAMPASASWIPDEGELVRACGLHYYHIPVIWEQPSLDNLRQFFELMDVHRGQKVFVHCALNMRVSAFVYLYRVLRMNEAPERAALDLHRIWKPDPDWQRFIDQALSAYPVR